MRWFANGWRRAGNSFVLAAALLAAWPAQAALVTLTTSGRIWATSDYAPFGLSAGTHDFSLAVSFDDATTPLPLGMGTTEDANQYADAVRSISLQFGAGPAIFPSLKPTGGSVITVMDDLVDPASGGHYEHLSLMVQFQVAGTADYSLLLLSFDTSDTAQSLAGSAGALDDDLLTSVAGARFDGFQRSLVSMIARPPEGHPASSAYLLADTAMTEHELSVSTTASTAAVPEPSTLALLAAAALGAAAGRRRGHPLPLPLPHRSLT